MGGLSDEFSVELSVCVCSPLSRLVDFDSGTRPFASDSGFSVLWLRYPVFTSLSGFIYPVGLSVFVGITLLECF